MSKRFGMLHEWEILQFCVYGVCMGVLFGDMHDHMWLSHPTTISTTVDILSSLHPVTYPI